MVESPISPVHPNNFRRRYDFPEALVILFSTGIAFTIFNAFALDFSGVPINAWIVLAATLTELAALVWIARRRDIELGLPVLDSAIFVGIVLVVTGYMIYPSIPALLPPTHHYDAVLHVAISDYIFRTNSLPHDFSGRTPPYFAPGFPVGGLLMVALASHWLGRVPIDTLHPFISFVLGWTAGLTFLIIRRLLRDIRLGLPIALLGTFFLFTAWTYFPGSVSDRYFFAETFAQFFVLLTFYYLQNYAESPDLDAVLLIGISVVAVLFSHPLPTIAPAFAVAIVLIVTFFRDPKRVAFHSVVLAAGLSLVAASYVVPHWNSWLSIAGYGEAPAFGVDSVGLVLSLLGTAGLILALQKRWRAKCGIWFLMFVAILMQPVTLVIGSFFIRGVSSYQMNKSVYLLIYPLAIFAAVALAEAVAIASKLQVTRLVPATWALSIVGIPLILIAFPPRPFAPVTESELKVAEWSQSHIDITNLALVSSIREDEYWIRVAVWGLPPSSAESSAAYNIGSMDYSEWRGNPGEPDYALVRNIERIPHDSTVTTVYRDGDSAVLLKPRGSIGAPPVPQYETNFRFGDVFDLTGYAMTKSFAPNESIPVTFYWRPLRWPTGRVSMFIQVLNSLGDVVARSENEMFQKRFPTQRWPIGTVVTDTSSILLPPETDAGEYTLEVAVFDKATGTRFPVNAPDSEPTDRIILGPIRVSIPAPSQAEIQSAEQADIAFGDAISLRAYALSPRRVGHGDLVGLTLYWERIAPIDRDYIVFVHLLDSSGHIVAQVDTPPQSGTYPTTVWRPDEIVKDPYFLKIPKDLPVGPYRIEFGLYTASDLKRLAVAGGDHVTLDDAITVK